MSAHTNIGLLHRQNFFFMIRKKGQGTTERAALLTCHFLQLPKWLPFSTYFQQIGGWNFLSWARLLTGGRGREEGTTGGD
jgi:hypothetical protein